jgi:hypothetical protein
VNLNDIRMSAVLPCYKDPLLVPTIKSLLDTSELGDRLEIVCCLDGFWPTTFAIPEDKHVRIIHRGQNRGMRESINAAVAVSRGEYITRFDEHTMISQGWDRLLADACKPNWILVPRRFALDPIRWCIMTEVPKVDYMKLKIVRTARGRKFSGVAWDRPDRESIEIDETPAYQGSAWTMKRSWWDTVAGPLQTEGYGPLTQDSHEQSFKTWQAGGKVMVHKGVWHAHRHRSFHRTHNSGGEDSERSFAYALSVWEPYFHKEIEPRWANQ